MIEPNVLAVIPFGVLLLSIAILPVLAGHWWEKHYAKLALALGSTTTIYYLAVLRDAARLETVAVEYVGFITLIGSLYVVASGIHIQLASRATPLRNTGLLAFGAVLANLIGTTGASLLLIRPFLRSNQPRVATHHVIFFIFLVSNIGGALTPIGDPPLFLGYLKGVPFFWLLAQPTVLGAWLLCLGVLLTLFFLLDVRHFRRSADAPVTPTGKAAIGGATNLVWLLVLVVIVLAQNTAWLKSLGHTGVLLASGSMIGTAALAYRTTRRAVHHANEFSFAPLREVGILFAGIFATMVPALDLLAHHAGALGIRTVSQFYWSTGLCSGVLDNAPTYLSFLTAAFGLQHLSLETPADMTHMLGNPGLARYVVAVSLGAVFFGASTLIGNGPNFMVKGIAERAGVKCPSFLGYIVKFSLPILLPLFAVVAWLFLR